MSNRYTNCAIEVHLCNQLEGTPLDGLDEDASNARARQLVADTFATAYPQYSVHVHMDYHTYDPDVVVGCPDELDPTDILEATRAALENMEAWYVDAPDAPVQGV